MYECPNCAGNLKFDIARQQMYCEHCDTVLDPYRVSEGKRAEGHRVKVQVDEIIHKIEQSQVVQESLGEEYEVTIFTCPQCGGELISDDTTAATFCSFCGSTALLDSRVSRERRPDKIIPFSKTREDCREAYAKMMRRAIFAPKELKDEKSIEKFRGIYMPYWVYSFGKSKTVTFDGNQSHWEGDWQVFEHYKVTTDIVEDYTGLTYDASVSFSDSLSEKIAPFDIEQGREFTPAYLSGFYADTNDIDETVYQQKAEDTVVEDAFAKFKDNYVCADYNVDAGYLQGAVEPDTCKAELMMLPVWFLSYRKKGRMFYAVVNGQTGKAAAEIPVDLTKYLLSSLLLAVPFFFLLNSLVTLTPVGVLLLTIIVAVCCILIANAQMTAILARDMNIHDAGYAAFLEKRDEEIKKEVKRERSLRTGMYQDPELQEQMEREQEERRRARNRLRDNSPRNPMRYIGRLVLFTLVMAVVSMMLFGNAGELWVYQGEGILLSIVLIGVLLPFTVGVAYFMLVPSAKLEIPGELKRDRENWRKKKRSAWMKSLIGIVIALVILVMNPVEDWYYYAGVVVCLLAVQWSIVDIIRHHNMFTTRKLPQFNRRGGDENA